MRRPQARDTGRFWSRPPTVFWGAHPKFVEIRVLLKIPKSPIFRRLYFPPCPPPDYNRAGFVCNEGLILKFSRRQQKHVGLVSSRH